MDVATIGVEAIVQALLLVTGAMVAVRLDRRARYRRAVEEAVLRLDAPWQAFVSQVTSPDPEYTAWSEADEAITKLMIEIEIKAAGYGRRRRGFVRDNAQQIRAAVTASVWRRMEGATGPPTDVALKRLFEHYNELRRQVIGDFAGPFRGVRDWILEMNTPHE